MAYKMKYTNGKKADPSAFPFKTEENTMDNTMDNNVGGAVEKGKNDKLIELLKKENEISKQVQEAKQEKDLATKMI